MRPSYKSQGNVKAAVLFVCFLQLSLLFLLAWAASSVFIPAHFESASSGEPVARSSRRLLHGVHTKSTASLENSVGVSSALAVCVSISDEAPHIREWIVYHHALGVSQFYIHDVDSSGTVKALTADFVETGLVIYQHHSWPVVEADLPLAAIACLDEHGHKHDWMGFIDVNEYIVLKRGFSVVTLLDSYRAFAAVQLPLQPLIASGPTRPNLLSSHTRCCLREHRERLKSIIQPKYTSRVVNSYEYQHVVGYKVVTPWYMEDDQSVEAHLADAILLYRYEFEATQQRVENPPDQPGGELKLTGYESSDPVSTPGNQLSMLQVSDSRPVNCGLLQKWWTDHTALYGLL